ncbi:MFS transporter [Deinococcus sedimenti]|uniref:MFS transporter n=1 Tax=Deinococcus sedimenti TaxID=1867090 RepID=A0ABQ2S504_9DEIO|nr:MFS transporter [Deinococcus sedimenti]GGR92750.1 MFS transporter [Deinococcus sedimenti]
MPVRAPTLTRPRQSHPAQSGHGPLVPLLALVTTAGYGALYYAQPVLAIAAEAERGWTRTHTSLPFTGALLVTAFLAPSAGRALDMRGGRTLLPAGAVAGAAGFALMTAPGFAPYLLGWLLVGVGMTLTFYEAAFTVLGQQRRGAARTRATLQVTLVAGLASTIFVPLVTALTQRSLNAALLSLAALLLVTALLARWYLPAGPASPPALTAGTTPDPPRPFRPDRPLRILTLGFTLARIVTVGVGLQLAPLLLDAGYSPAHAAVLTGLAGLAALPGRILFVPLLRLLPPATLTATLCASLGAGALLLTLAPGPAVPAGILIFGLASGALTLARAQQLAVTYPHQFGAANGHLARPVNLAQALTPLVMGGLFTWTGLYRPSLLLMAALGGAAALTLRR